jgi:hypothetical protein
MSYTYIYIVLINRWCNITVLNARASTEDLSGASKERFGEELEHVLDQFSIIRKLYSEILMQTCREKMFSNTQLGMRVYMKI